MANLTPNQTEIDRCTRKVDESTHQAYYEVQSESSTALYEVRYNRQYKRFSCSCPAGQDGFTHCSHGTCKHVRWSVAAEAQHQTEVRINRDADLAEAMESRSAEEISEQAAIQSYVNQGVDRATAERVTYAKPATNEGKGHLGYFANTGFSLLK